MNLAIWITIFWVLITFINLSGVRGYGECEMIFAMLKISAVVMFVITGIIIDAGGSPNGEVLGFKYWNIEGIRVTSLWKRGSFNNGFKGLCSNLITAAFSLAGTELVGLAAAETDNPRKTIPRATKQVFWRLILFYFSSLFIVACIVPYTHPQLLASTHSADLRASPFVIAIHDAGIKGLPSVINAVILISVLSVGKNSSTYASTRTLHALAEVHQAPKILRYVDKAGRPLRRSSIRISMWTNSLLLLPSWRSNSNFRLSPSSLRSIFPFHLGLYMFSSYPFSSSYEISKSIN